MLHSSVSKEEVYGSITKASRQHVLDSERKFWRPDEVEGGMDTLLALEAENELRQPYPSLFWRGVSTRFGMANPPLEMILSVLFPEGGWGYTGHSAANKLGLSTQIPKHTWVSIPYLPPHGSPGMVEIVHRPEKLARLRHGLGVYEVTLLEVLNEFAEEVNLSEHSYNDSLNILRRTVQEKVKAGNVIIPRLIAGSLDETLKVRKLLQGIIFP